jgi:YbbR domain-containing protein
MDRIPGKNITAKLVALIIAAILWMYVMNEQNPPLEASFQVPLEVHNLSSGVLAVDVPETVRVKVRGPRNLLAGFGMQDIKAYVDLKGLGEGHYPVKIQTAIPSSLETVEVNPDKFMIKLDVTLSRQLPVEVKLIGTPAARTVVNKTTPSLAQVTVDGPKSQLDTVDKVVAYVDISDKNADFTAEAPLSLINRSGKEVEGLQISASKVNVAVALMQEADKKMVNIKTLFAGELPKGVVLRRIITVPDKVELYGPAASLDKIDFVYTEPIQLSAIDKNIEREVKVQQLADGIVSTPNSVVVNISVSKTP